MEPEFLEPVQNKQSTDSENILALQGKIEEQHVSSVLGLLASLWNRPDIRPQFLFLFVSRFGQKQEEREEFDGA